MNKTYTIDDYKPYIGDGRSAEKPLPLPNAKDVDPMNFLQNLAAVGHGWQPVWGWAMLPDGSRQQWTQFFLTSGVNMSGALGGGGYAVTYGPSRWDAENRKNIESPIVRSFSICVHEKVLDAGADERRGWSPGRCKHCGVNMTIDSSD